MASLTRGISFRRQGSSGMSWKDTWTFNEDGVLVRKMKDENAQHVGGSLARIHDSQDADPGASNPGPSVLGRSKSVGSATASANDSNHKSGFRLVKWIKKAFTKRRN